MSLSEAEFATTHAELRAPLARIRLLHYRSAQPMALSGTRSSYRLDLGLMPRMPDARACFPERWGPRRYERLGRLFLLPRGEVVRTRSGAGANSSLAIDYDAAAASAWFGHEGWPDAFWRAGLDVQSTAACGALLRLKEELVAPGFGGETLCELLAAQAAIEIARFCGASTGDPAAGGLAPWQLRTIEDRLAEGGAIPPLAILARLCGISIRHLTRGYRASRGCSIGETIAHVRLERAKARLAIGEPIASVAASAGFASPTNFTAAFRRATGETPRSHRQRMARRY